MITPDGWLDWAARVPGPPDKIYSTVNSARMYIPHSAVGLYPGWSARLFSRARTPDGRYTLYAAASVHGWIAYDGTVTQHYPFTASCWASGSAYPNTNGVAFENEGGFQPENEPLTPGQVNANVRIIRELAAWKRWPEIRRPVSATDVQATLYEHRECVRWGSAPTACPSGRIPWAEILRRLNDAHAQKEDDDMMTPHSWEAVWFKGDAGEGRAYSPGVWGFEARGDFGLPATAKLAKFAVYLKSGRVRFRQPNGGWAEEIGFDGGRYGVVNAYLKADNFIDFEVIGGAEFQRVVCLGYW